MLTIRAEQLEALRRPHEDAFVASIRDHLRKDHQALVQSLRDRTLERRIRKGLAVAQRFGMDSTESRTSFVILMFIAGPRFALHPTAREILADRNRSGTARLSELIATLSDDDWQDVARAYDDGAWK